MGDSIDNVDFYITFNINIMFIVLECNSLLMPFLIFMSKRGKLHARKCMTRKGKSLEDDVKIKQIMHLKKLIKRD